MTPESPLDSKEIKPVNLKGDQPWIFTGRTDAQAPVILVIWYRWLFGKVPDAGKDWGQKKRVSQDKMVGWNHWRNEQELGQTSGDGEGQGDLACCGPCGCKESETTVWLNNNKVTRWGPRWEFLMLSPKSENQNLMVMFLHSALPEETGLGQPRHKSAQITWRSSKTSFRPPLLH